MVYKIFYLPKEKQKSETELPPYIKERLYDFQLKSIKFAVNNYGRILIGDEMGMGKTVQALAIAWLYKENFPLLIVVPS